MKGVIFEHLQLLLQLQHHLRFPCEFIFGLEDIVADIRILETGSNSCALGEGRIL